MERYIPTYNESSSRYHITCCYDNDRHETLAEGYEKVKGGVKYFIGRYKAFDMAGFKKDIETKGWFSQRPYQLAQRCDGTISYPVDALYYQFCKHSGIDPDKAIALAYPGERKTDWKTIMKEARWQGVVFPEEWGEKEMEGLLESLTGTNNHSLNSVLQEMMEQTVEKQQRREELRDIRKRAQINEMRIER